MSPWVKDVLKELMPQLRVKARRAVIRASLARARGRREARAVRRRRAS